MIDNLGDRMKRYEKRETGRTLLPRTFYGVRLDGRNFTRFTRHMKRPYDTQMFDAMDTTTKYLIAETHALVGYTQSDEINLVYSDHDEALFGGRLFKLTSVLAGMCSARFTVKALDLWPELTRLIPPAFDCRVFELPDQHEAVNMLIWRELDATKNAVSMAASAKFSPTELYKINGNEMQEMLFQRYGINFNDYPERFKRGAYYARVAYNVELDAATLADIPEQYRPQGEVERTTIRQLILPPILKVKNRVQVLLQGAEPELFT